MEKIKITTGTILRTLALVLALVNQVLAAFGKSAIPVSNDQLAQIISTVLTLTAALTAWWNNNSFTARAIVADSVQKTLRTTGTKGIAVTVSDTIDVKG